MDESGEHMGDEVVARYRARGSDVVMIKWVTPVVIVALIAFAVVSGDTLGVVAFGLAALVVAVRWLWVVLFGPRPVALELDLTADALRVRTMARRLEIPVRQVRAVSPAGLRPRERGPRALATDAGSFTLFPDGAGFGDLVAALRLSAPHLEVADASAEGAGAAPSRFGGAPAATSEAPMQGGAPAAADDTGLVPGVVALRVFGSQTLADVAVRKLDGEGITALTLPSESGLGGIRLAVKEEDRERAEAILDE